MQIQFHCLTDTFDIGKYPSIIIKKSALQSEPMLVISYREVRNKKIKSILENCDSLNLFLNYGIKICNTILKPNDTISQLES
jgi:3-dehydroquinate synthase class II